MYFVNIFLLGSFYQRNGLYFNIVNNTFTHSEKQDNVHATVVNNNGKDYAITHKLYIKYKNSNNTSNNLYKLSKDEVVVIVPQNESVFDHYDYYKSMKNVENVSLSYYISINYLYNDPQLTNDYAKTVINVYDAWKYASGENTKIVVVDSGIDFNHEDLLEDPNVKGDSWLNHYPYSSDGNYGRYVSSNSNHGTQCAGVSGALRDNFKGSCGVSPKTSLVSINIGNSHIQSDRIRLSLSYYISYEAVFSFSWNINLPLVTYNDADLFHFKYIFDESIIHGRNGKGSIFVWASGNDRIDKKSTSLDEFTSHRANIVVGSCDSDYSSSYFSRPGPALTISAPGSNVYTTNIHNTYVYVSGTSFSCPIVSACITLMIEKRPELTWRDVQMIIMKTATVPSNPISSYGNPTNSEWITNDVGFKFNNYYGAGVINVSKAVDWAKNKWYPLLPQDYTITKLFSSNRVFVHEAMYTEHVSVKIKSFGTGSKIVLVSPKGTRSELFPLYSDNFIGGSTSEFDILTNAYFGENSNGVWNIEITGSNTYNHIQLIINGCYNMPESLINLMNLKSINNISATPPLAPPPPLVLCTNNCYWRNDGDCDDGGSGSDYNSCDHGSDCGDCGQRYTRYLTPSPFLPPTPPPPIPPPPIPPPPITPPPITPPPTPPPPTPPLQNVKHKNKEAEVNGDPHLTLVFGGRTDFRGNDKTFYNLLSDKYTTVNCFIEYVKFKIKKLTVYGSVITELHIHHKSQESSYFSIYSKDINKHNNARVLTNCSGIKKTINSYNNFTCYDTFMRTYYSTSIINTPQWEISIVSLDVFGYVNGPPKNINVKFKKIKEGGTVHGIIGQSFMFSKPIYGKMDNYPTHGTYTTTAMAEGAIEGVPDDYIVKNDFDEEFNFKYKI